MMNNLNQLAEKNKKLNQIKTIVREVAGDLDTPAGVYLKLRDDGPSFLLESVEGGENIARYSFIGVHPKSLYILFETKIQVIDENGTSSIQLVPGSDPTQFLQAELADYDTTPIPGLPRFIGGLVGFMGYEIVRFFEPGLKSLMHSSDFPDAIYMLADIVIAFDHVKRSIFLIANVLDNDEEKAIQKLDRIEAQLLEPIPAQPKKAKLESGTVSNLNQEEFSSMVKDAKEKILTGDIFQVVLSQRFDQQSSLDPFEVYRAVRRLNPSPYMFYFDFGLIQGKPFHLVGASPELFVRLEDRKAALRPIAGTRRRGNDPILDAALAEELLADSKECAEHVMLVDLGRNDLGRVCEYGSVKVTEFSTIERYSHVMHMVSHVEGLLRPDLTAFDIVRAAFPAGTVSGAPKVRAMEIIASLEKDWRGPYAGMIGYFGFDGAMDTCLAIRTMVAHGSTFSVQAGAGIVADSDPVSEYHETINKAAAMLRAIEIASQSQGYSGAINK